MQINMDFSQKVICQTTQQSWLASPSQGVWRKPLEREEKESGHTTSIVRYEPNTKFSTHAHPQGEEIFVLEGVFSDENGDYPAGTYLRNPPGSKHTPFSSQGCTIFVKLNQFQADDDKTIRINTHEMDYQQGIGRLRVKSLFSHNHEHIAIVHWPKGERFQLHSHWGGEEILVLTGTFRDEHGIYPQGTWLRSPHMSRHFPFVNEDTTILVKTGHLPDI